MTDRFDLEQDIMSCWGVVDDIKLVMELVCDSGEFVGLPAKAEDRLANLLLGLQSMYQLKFEKCFRTFETLLQQGNIK